MVYVNVVVNNKSKYTDSLFTYRTNDGANAGDLVKLPFGSHNTVKEAIVVEKGVLPDCDEDKIKKYQKSFSRGCFQRK